VGDFGPFHFVLLLHVSTSYLLLSGCPFSTSLTCNVIVLVFAFPCAEINPTAHYPFGQPVVIICSITCDGKDMPSSFPVPDDRFSSFASQAFAFLLLSS
jgi:hypothetical protein